MLLMTSNKSNLKYNNCTRQYESMQSFTTFAIQRTCIMYVLIIVETMEDLKSKMYQNYLVEG